MCQRAARMIVAVGLERVADSPYGLLSTGEKVRTQIARAVAIRLGLLILDEPTNGLDLLAREQVLLTAGVKTPNNSINRPGDRCRICKPCWPAGPVGRASGAWLL